VLHDITRTYGIVDVVIVISFVHSVPVNITYTSSVRRVTQKAKFVRIYKNIKQFLAWTATAKEKNVARRPRRCQITGQTGGK